ncbi:coiled-coil domain-containing protein 181 isoform X3 [Electrophorus electricus]|uniref:coiled-coil domain-containing protein 181 isoform X3 n=1 Tax=Electrophorus electricus TaxID=8005 RepID=UPI0015D0902D|nr:coiled-coil domain-containing protein 181 isoform X3 [Electrophorus electricus]
MTTRYSRLKRASGLNTRAGARRNLRLPGGQLMNTSEHELLHKAGGHSLAQGEMSTAVCTNTQEEYDDDFEKDLDWLISEDEGKGAEQDPDDDDDDEDDDGDEDVEAQIDKALDENEKRVDEGRDTPSKGDDSGAEEHRLTPTDGDRVTTETALAEDNEDEENQSLLQKIEQANRQLQDQEAPDQMRRRRLQFKDTLVDLVVPAQNYSAPCRDLEVDGDVAEQMLELKISPQEQREGGDVGGDRHRDGQRVGAREGRVLVERDGKFDLVSYKEVESQGLLPPLPGCHSDGHHGSPRTQTEPVKSSSLSVKSSLALQAGTEPRHVPRPPLPRGRVRPNSASHTQGPSGRQGIGGTRRVQSASGAPALGTFTLSPQQKELLTKQQQRRQKLAQEEEERRREEEEHKREENELAFRAWLAKKRLQLQDERRVQRAQQMEWLSCKKECSDPDEAFRLWLQKKQEQHLKERQLEEMKRLERDSAPYLRTPEERDKAFALWLRRKRAEQRAEQRAARVRSRRLMLEVRRARRAQRPWCSVSESRPFRFDDPYSYCF